MNPILKQCYESRNGNYCHVIEVSDVYEVQNIVESIANEGWSKPDLIEFFNTIDVYCMVQDNEEEVFSFNFESFINELN